MMNGHDATSQARSAEPVVASASGQRPFWPSRHTAHLVFAILIAANVVRTLRHAMWRDELEPFQIAVASPSLTELFLKLRYEGHPGLWYALVWLVTFFTSDPVGMQLLHLAIAVAVWWIIYRWSPFNLAEKLLLLTSYFLFWEYFVISRMYALVALIGFAFVALRQHRPQQTFTAWLLLGLLANAHVFGAIWSMVMAAILAIQEPRRDRWFLAGGATYLAVLALAVVTMRPAADFAPWATDVRFELSRFGGTLAIPLGAFVPIDPAWVKEAFPFLAEPGAAAPPRFWNPNPIREFVALTHADADHPLRLMLALAAPIGIFWLISRVPLRTLEFAAVYLGILLFANIWSFPGTARHHGIVFLALIACVWMSRSVRPADTLSSWLLTAILGIGAVGGLLTLASELQPFSQGRNAADWIKSRNLSAARLIGSRDAQVSSVAGYLGRPIYYLECECYGTFVVWNSRRQSPLPGLERGYRLLRALDLPESGEAVLILNTPIAPAEMEFATSLLSLTLLETFVGSVTNENFWIYRVRKLEPGPPSSGR